MGNVCDRIEPYLWLGDKHTFTSKELTRFAAVVTAMLEVEVQENKIKEKVGTRSWLFFNVDDSEDQDISQYFLETVQFIERHRAEKNTILVHCAGGISRSTTLVAAYLMWEHGWTRKQAIEYVTTRRKIIDPNDGFMDQLLMYEGVLTKLKESHNNAPIEEQVKNNEPRHNV